MGNNSEKSKKGGVTLYHASPKRGLKEFTPRRKSRRQEGDPPRVYATPEKKIAAGFIIRPTDDWCVYGSYDDSTARTWSLVVGDEKKFWKLENKGGSLYTLPRQTFRFETGIGLGKDEWFSEEKVPVLAEEKWVSACQAMLHYGVKIYFLPSGKFKEFKSLCWEEQEGLCKKATSRKDGKSYNIEF